MRKQNQIKRTLSEPQTIKYIGDLLESTEFSSCSELARNLCEHFQFYDVQGEEQFAGCYKALRELETAGHLILPKAGPQSRSGPRKPKRLLAPVAEPINVPEQAGKIIGLALIPVSTEEHIRIWNEMMIREHPRGHGPLVGRQVRYLVASQHGWLGGFGFAAAALHLAERDKWIGWDLEQRRNYLSVVVNMSRFLIRPSVRCANLASHLLGMAVERLPEDFDQKYGYRPLLLESFVDTAQFEGTCYRAANWMFIGRTQGRGRQDRLMEAKESIKDIYMYPLVKNFRSLLGLPPDAGRSPLDPSDGLESDVWAENEFGGAPLGDLRLSKRLVKIADDKTDEPWRAYCSVSQGNWHTGKAYYRFIGASDESEVTMENILRPHRERTLRRMSAQHTVLCVQDSSDLNYTNLATCTGLGELSANQTDAKRRGLLLHSTLTLTTTGLPLGILKSQCEALRAKSPEDKRRSHAIPIEEKKTFNWIKHQRDLVEVAVLMPHTRLVQVCEREADFFEMFDEQRHNPSVELLIRAKHDRNLAGNAGKLFDKVRESPDQGSMDVLISRKSVRPKRSKQKASEKRLEREAELTLRFLCVELPAPDALAGREPISITIIHASEENPPAGVKPIEWFLLTTLDVKSVEDAEEYLGWYALRWRIEDWHRVLKVGCKIEDIAHESAGRLRRAIGINLVIAWRIMVMTLLGREVPNLPAEVLFTDLEIRMLEAFAKKKGQKTPEGLGDAVRLLANIGGYLGRKSDPPPRHQVIWWGCEKLRLMCIGYELRKENLCPD